MPISRSTFALMARLFAGVLGFAAFSGGATACSPASSADLNDGAAGSAEASQGGSSNVAGSSGSSGASVTAVAGSTSGGVSGGSGMGGAGQPAAGAGGSAGGSDAFGGNPDQGGNAGSGTLGGSSMGGSAGSGATSYKPCPTSGDPCKLLPFGDSITRGVKSSDDAGYRSQLFKLIVAAKQKVAFIGSLTNGPTQVSGQPFPRTHEGHAGWTIDPGYSESGGYGGISSLVPSPALNGGPHIVLLHIGTNDLFSTKDTATMSTRLDALVEMIAQNAPSALIVLAQLTPVGATNNGHTQAQVDAANAAQMAYNGAIPGIVDSHAAKGQHIVMVDMSKLPVPQGLTTDSVHPNDLGYAYMASIWYAAIKDLLPN